MQVWPTVSRSPLATVAGVICVHDVLSESSKDDLHRATLQSRNICLRMARQEALLGTTRGTTGAALSDR